MKLSHKAFIALMIAVIELAIYPIPLAFAGKAVGTVQLLFYVFILGSITSLTVAYFWDGLKGFKAIVFGNKRLLVIVLLMGLGNDAISQVLLGIGAVGTNPSVAAILFRSWVIMSAILVPFILRQRVTKLQYLAVFIGFLGIYLIVANGSISNINSSALPFIGAVLGAAFVVTLTNLAMKMHNVDLVGAIALFNLVSVLFFGLYALGTGTSLAISFSPDVIIGIVFLGVVTYGIGSTFYYYALKVFGPILMGNSMLLVPFLTIPLSYLFLGTEITWIYIGAAILLSVGVLLQRRESLHAPGHINRRSAQGTAEIFDITSAFVSNQNPEISQRLSGNNRSFAIKVDGSVDEAMAKEMFSKNNCIVFTTKNPHIGVGKEELEFIHDVMGVKDDETAVVGVGDEKTLESTFHEFSRLNGTRGETGPQV